MAFSSGPTENFAMTQDFFGLTACWLILDPKDRFGPRNIGVSACSRRELADILESNISQIKTALHDLLSGFHPFGELITGIDLQCLDPVRVRPFIGDVSNPGIWWPILPVTGKESP